MGPPLGPTSGTPYGKHISLLHRRETRTRQQTIILLQKIRGDTLATMRDVPAAEAFSSTLNNCHSSISFTMELASDNKLPSVGMEVFKKGCKLETSVYRKPTDTGLLLHHQSQVGKRHFWRLSRPW